MSGGDPDDDDIPTLRDEAVPEIPVLDEAVESTQSAAPANLDLFEDRPKLDEEALREEIIPLLSARLEEIMDDTVRDIEVTLVERLGARMRLEMPEILEQAIKNYLKKHN